MKKPYQIELFSKENFTRRCKSCKKEFPRTQNFFEKGRSHDGLHSTCKYCLTFKIKKKRLDFDKNFYSKNKICLNCNLSKLLSEYYMDSKIIDGKSRYCKKCTDLYNKIQKKRKSNENKFNWTINFIQNTSNLRIKIGISRDPYKFFMKLQQDFSVLLRLSAFIEVQNKHHAELYEKQLRKVFSGCYVKDGWFECLNVLQEYILLIKENKNVEIPNRINIDPIKFNIKKNKNNNDLIRVEGQIFPDLKTAKSATGFSDEQLIKTNFKKQ